MFLTNFDDVHHVIFQNRHHVCVMNLINVKLFFVNLLPSPAVATFYNIDSLFLHFLFYH